MELFGVWHLIYTHRTLLWVGHVFESVRRHCELQSRKQDFSKWVGKKNLALVILDPKPSLKTNRLRVISGAELGLGGTVVTTTCKWRTPSRE